MLKEINGNLLDFPSNINIIVHQTNCQNTFGAGIAFQIKKRYPEAYEADSIHYKVLTDLNKSMMGTISSVCVHEQLERYVVNLYAQNLGASNKRATSYDAFAKGLDELRAFVDYYPTTFHPIIGFPKGIACGLGGGSWNVIKAMLEDFQTSCNYKVYIVNFGKEIQATALQNKKVA